MQMSKLQQINPAFWLMELVEATPGIHSFVPDKFNMLQ